ncbi:pseudouridine synthase 10 isoform X2 [Cotesia typhae]|uniref:pseudouridine synthase 10 isoform X2 n=1 Tax=Cotesia typhae TaxID=2053667 RepID=UPI003D693A3B
MNFEVSNIIQKAEFLRSLGCCSVCSLRLSGIPNNDNFHSTITYSDTMKNIFGDLESNQTSEICIICLGILQNEIQNSSVEKISREIKLSGFDSEVFTCTLNIPISVKLREKSISTLLNQKTKESHWNGPDINKYSIKEIWKMLILPKVEKMTSKRQTTSLASSPFSVNIFFSYSNDEIDCENLMKKYLNSLKLTKKQTDNRFSKNNIDKILNDITEEIAMEAFSTPPSQPLVHAIMDKVKCTRESLFVGGRYMKLSRKLSQTPWFVNGQKKMETSVQDILCNVIVNYTRAESFKFLSSGREDIDVRTINIGRPFAIELINPKITTFSSETFRKLVVQINDSSDLVKISSHLRILSPKIII